MEASAPGMQGLAVLSTPLVRSVGPGAAKELRALEGELHAAQGAPTVRILSSLALIPTHLGLIFPLLQSTAPTLPTLSRLPTEGRP